MRPHCEKCDRALSDDLKCAPCGREYTHYWLVLKQRGER